MLINVLIILIESRPFVYTKFNVLILNLNINFKIFQLFPIPSTHQMLPFISRSCAPYFIYRLYSLYRFCSYSKYYNKKVLLHIKFVKVLFHYMILCSAHLPLINLSVNIMPLIVQSANIPIHTAIGPKPHTLHR